MSITIKQALDRIKSKFDGKLASHTCDTLKTGKPSDPVRGIVVTFLASRQVLEQTVAQGANLIITHEPTFYNHADDVMWLEKDPTYLSKIKFIDQHGLAIWRSHDAPHIHKPDMIVSGMIRELGWEGLQDPELPDTYGIAPISLEQLIEHCKEKLGIKAVRCVGDPKLVCKKAVLCVGAGGGRHLLDRLMKPGVEVGLSGEGPEWETCEYVRDAVASGEKKALIVLGHANSEEGGMKWMSEWVAKIVPEVPVTHIPAGDPFRFA